MASSNHREWLEAEVVLFAKMIDERRSLGEMEFTLMRTEEELEAKAAELHQALPQEYEPSFLLRVRSLREGRVRKTAPPRN